MLEPPSRSVPHHTTSPPWFGGELDSKFCPQPKTCGCPSEKNKTKKNWRPKLSRALFAELTATSRRGNSQLGRSSRCSEWVRFRRALTCLNSVPAATSRGEKTAVHNIKPALASRPAHRVERPASIGSRLLPVSPHFVSNDRCDSTSFARAPKRLRSQVAGALRRRATLAPRGGRFAQEHTNKVD